VINNAGRCADLEREVGSLADYVWRFEPDPKSRPKRLTWEALRDRVAAPESVALSEDLRTRGLSFVGPARMYAFMRAMGLVNDHLHGCAFRRH
jgi:DNA-3-methyladenine glycosylase I